MMRTWGAYVHYLLRALGRLPNVACDVFRGYARPTDSTPFPPWRRRVVASTGRVPLAVCLRALVGPLRGDAWARLCEYS